MRKTQPRPPILAIGAALVLGLACGAPERVVTVVDPDASSPESDGVDGFDGPAEDVLAEVDPGPLDTASLDTADAVVAADAAPSVDEGVVVDATSIPDMVVPPDMVVIPDTAVAPDAAAPPDDVATPDVPAEQDSAEQEDVAPQDDVSAAEDITVEDVPILCPEPPQVPPVPSDLLDGVSPPGPTETLTGQFTDDFLYDSTSYIKIGTRREWGGSIVFFGLANAPGLNASNVIDGNDTGREVQIALYDPARAMQGCAWNASCATQPSTCLTSITNLGWNPVQGGNECNHGSGVDTATAEPGVLRAEVTPLHWNPDWEDPSCVNAGCADPVKSWLRSDIRYTQRLRFVRTHVVELQMTVDNLSDLEHGVTLQEFPTLYAAWGQGGPNLHRILDSAGNAVAVDVPANDGFFMKDFDSAGGFVALQNDTQDYGVGIYYENRLTAFQAWQREGVFNNVRARFAFGIPAYGRVMARAYLVLGAFSTIATELAALDAALPPFGALDAPSLDQSVSGSVLVSGWALDNKGVTAIELLLDGVVVLTLPRDRPRPDVCRQWPGYPGCDTVGFEGTLPVSGLSCAHLIQARAVDTDGNVRVVGSTRVIVQ